MQHRLAGKITRPILLATFAASVAFSATAQTTLNVGDTPATDFVSLDPANVDLAIAALPDLVEKVMAQTGIPGLAVAVVHKDKVVYMQGFGLRELPNGAPVTVDTVFQIASVSKPMATTVAAIQVSQGVVSWDDPVSRYLPNLHLSDDYVVRNATIGDFFAHRSGLPGAAGDELEDLGFDRTMILDRLSLLPLEPFRITYNYANFGTTIAAEAVAAAAGAEWETLSEETLYAPLGMSNTSSRHSDFAARANKATLHAFQNGAFLPLYKRDADAQAPAGGVSSSVSDMAKWLRLILAGGMYEGKRYFDEAALIPAITPQVVTRRGASPDARSGFYGYGFNVGVTASGRTEISHSGAFVSGAATRVQMIPEMDLGIVILTNGGPVGIPEAISADFMDLAQFGTISRDWMALFGGAMTGLNNAFGDLAGAVPPSDPAPTASLDSYVGTYENAYFGAAKVELVQSGLVIALGPEPQRFPLQHWNGDTFAISPVNENAPKGSLSSVTFQNAGGAYNAVTIEYLDENGLGVWTR